MGHGWLPIAKRMYASRHDEMQIPFARRAFESSP